MCELDFQGWRKENQGRRLSELVRELIQNVLDTETSEVAITSIALR